MIVSTDIAIVAERVEYFGDGAGSGKFGSIVSHGIAAPITEARFAYSSSGGTAQDSSGMQQPVGDQDYITLLNPRAGPGLIEVQANFSDATGHPVGHPITVSIAGETRKTIIANIPLGTHPVGPFSVSLTGSGPFVAEAAQYFGGSPNAGSHPGVAFPGTMLASGDVYLGDLSTSLEDGSAVTRSVYVYNPFTTDVQITIQYFGPKGVISQAVYAVPAGAITTIDVNQDTQGVQSQGLVGGEIRTVPGSAGLFIAFSVGTTIDGLSATEDVGVPA
jgi:hypothetical protein